MQIDDLIAQLRARLDRAVCKDFADCGTRKRKALPFGALIIIPSSSTAPEEICIVISRNDDMLRFLNFDCPPVADRANTEMQAWARDVDSTWVC